MKNIKRKDWKENEAMKKVDIENLNNEDLRKLILELDSEMVILNILIDK